MNALLFYNVIDTVVQASLTFHQVDGSCGGLSVETDRPQGDMRHEAGAVSDIV